MHDVSTPVPPLSRHFCFCAKKIVALNYQTSGTSMRLNEGKFRDNGGCGYVLKPRCLRRGTPFSPDSGPFPPGQMTLTVQVNFKEKKIYIYIHIIFIESAYL